MLELGCQAKVTNLQTSIGVQKEIAQLEISMDDTTPMQILQPGYQLIQVEHGLCLRQPLTWAFAHEFVQCLVWTYLQNDVDMFTILKVVVKADNLVII
jgi:hypothetical protein